MTTPTPRVERVKNETDGTPCLVRYMIELPKRIAKLEAERDEATSYAKNLAEGLHRKHYAEVTQWKPLDDLLGLLTQIDNMTTGLVRAIDLQEKP